MATPVVVTKEGFLETHKLEIAVGILVGAIVAASILQSSGCLKEISTAALWALIATLVAGFGLFFFKRYQASKKP